MSNYMQIAQDIREIAGRHLPKGEYLALSNKLDKIVGGMRKAERKAPKVAEAVIEEMDGGRQKDAVLRRLLAGQTLDAMDGLRLTDIRSMQLRTIICVLGKQGIDISREWITLPSGKRAKRYWMTPEQIENYQNNN